MSSLATLYFSIAVAVWAVLAVVVVHTTVGDAVGGAAALTALAIAVRAVSHLLADEEPTAGATRPSKAPL